MATLRIEINLVNAAGTECCRILQKLALNLEGCDHRGQHIEDKYSDPWNLSDVNGNRVGSVVVE